MSDVSKLPVTTSLLQCILRVCLHELQTREYCHMPESASTVSDTQALIDDEIASVRTEDDVAESRV